MEYLALDIETDTAGNGLDPNVAAITEMSPMPAWRTSWRSLSRHRSLALPNCTR